MVTKKHSSKNYKPKTSEKEWPIRPMNPMIGSSPQETIDNVTGALIWLQHADEEAHEAWNEQIQYGRFLLGECCTHALRFASTELAAKKEAA